MILLTLIVLAEPVSHAQAAHTHPSTKTADSGGFTVCGRMNYYSRSAPGIGINGVDYRLVGTGPVPDALGAIGTAMTPEVVRLTGRLIDASTNTVANYAIIRVPSCILPSTSTAFDSALDRRARQR